MTDEKLPRIVCRWSAGVASTVATALTLKRHHNREVLIQYCDPGSEHPDNDRFRVDVERWLSRPIEVLRSDKYRDTWDVWERERFIMSFKGAPCTGALKRAPAYPYSRPDDVLVFGFTVEERERADRIVKANFESKFEFPLIDAGLDKSDCLAIIDRAGIQLPAMYLLGYHNNNCIGCPKGGKGYWNKIRRDFPDVFDRMSKLQRELKSAAFWKELDGSFLFLDELAPDRGRHDEEPNIECSLMCVMAEQDIEGKS